MTNNKISAERLDYWRHYCQAKLGSSEETPFGPDALVYKVGGKIFALVRLAAPLSINLKCDPQEAMILRASFDAVIPGYHMNKKHWNTIDLSAELASGLVEGWLDDSYALVLKGLPKALQARLTEKA
ncbi:MmcQ/YjbR family DNA-binding protein [Reinekea sp.]|uniref:MmcQ/YjbR family DNA-binding protein n=1 Tax=Reinekea sp. TaxID=1970455 RepID=UPI002A821109|nr:MmcQ/YjbR family DNA-binding protein [Reinekea sp.]